MSTSSVALAVDDEAGVAPAPATVGLQVGVETIADFLQPLLVGPHVTIVNEEQGPKRSSTRATALVPGIAARPRSA